VGFGLTLQPRVVHHDRLDADEDCVVHCAQPGVSRVAGRVLVFGSIQLAALRASLCTSSTSTYTPAIVSSLIPNAQLSAAQSTNTHQCVINILSSPLSVTLAPPGPAIFASRLCAHVSVICGRSRVVGAVVAAATWVMRKGGGWGDMVGCRNGV
jgi:hypothetical protein